MFSPKFVALTLVACGAGALACHSESSNQATPQESSEPPAGSATEKKTQDKLARALASAIATDKAPKAAGGDASDTSPPADGVMDAAKADAQLPSNSPPKITLGAAGSEPRIALGHRPLTSPCKATMQLALDLGGGQGLPPVEFKLELRAPAKPDAKGVQPMTARVSGVDVSVPNVPDDFKNQLRQLVGSKMSYRVSADGGSFDFTSELGKSKHQELSDLLDMVVQGLAEANISMPSDPVGTGAYWMVVSRRKSLGLDWIVYDMVKVTAVTDKSATLEFTSRRYVVGRDIELGTQGPKLSVREASASDTAQATATTQGSLLQRYERNQSVKLLLDAADNSGQRMMQTGGQLKFQLSRP